MSKNNVYSLILTEQPTNYIKVRLRKTSHLRPIYLKRHALKWKAMHSKHENRGWFHRVNNGFD
jgi:hypothetical protein